MSKLFARSAGAGLLPLAIGEVDLFEAEPEAITAVSPVPGQEDRLEAALARLGLSFPLPGHSVVAKKARMTWMGRNQAFLLGPALKTLAGAHLTDQSDGWAVLHLVGPRTEQILARLVPVDLRLKSFPQGATARSMLGHMMVSVTRLDAHGFEVMVFRSMVATAVHELAEAARGLATRD